MLVSDSGLGTKLGTIRARLRRAADPPTYGHSGAVSERALATQEPVRGDEGVAREAIRKSAA